jgi:Na+-transporting NADH:ubiquinone oxidoreductase subunit NqrC
MKSLGDPSKLNKKFLLVFCLICTVLVSANVIAFASARDEVDPTQTPEQAPTEDQPNLIQNLDDNNVTANDSQSSGSEGEENLIANLPQPDNTALVVGIIALIASIVTVLVVVAVRKLSKKA